MSAANTRVVAVMQLVVGHLVDLDIGPDVGPGPFGERIHLHELKLAVPFNEFGIRSGRCLFTPDTGDPGIESLKDTGEWLDFSQFAAAVGIAGPERWTVRRCLPFWRQQRFDLQHLRW